MDSFENAEQQAAIDFSGGHLLVSAGPGTGKTFTLTARLARLLTEENVDPACVAAITFTRRAADELRSRLQQAVGDPAAAVFIGTFHAFALHGLQQQQPQLSVVGAEQREMILRNLFPDFSVRQRQHAVQTLENYFLGLVTDNAVEDDELFIDLPSHSPPLEKGGQGGFSKPAGRLSTNPPQPPFSKGGSTEDEIIQHYLDTLMTQNAIDLDAVIPTFVNHLENDEQARPAVQWLFVDEFQDLNHAQYRLVSRLAGQARVFGIGDPNQAIYGFRGADWRFFTRFADEHHATVLALTRNYRSQAQILETAHALIRHNDPDTPALQAQRPGGAAIVRFTGATAEAEAEWVAARIEALMGGTSHRTLSDSGETYGFADIAVLYRLSQQADPLRQALEARGIPVQQVGATPFFMRPPLRPLYHWLRAAADPGAWEHLPLLGAVAGIGATTQRQIERAVFQADSSPDEARRNPGLPPGFRRASSELQSTDAGCKILALPDLPARAREPITVLAEALQAFRHQAAEQGLAEAMPQAVAFLQSDSPDLPRLLHLAGAFGNDLFAFAEHLANQAQATVYDPRAEAVALMTLHAAKGLEFPAVFITGLEQGVLPCALPGLDAPEDEERRLCYRFSEN